MAQETAKIKGLLLDLRKDENKPYAPRSASTLTSPNWRKRITPTTACRSNASKTGPPPKRKAAPTWRKRIDVYYDDLTLLAQSHSVAKPSEKATAFIAALNQLIAETTAAYNQRMASAKKPAPGSRAYTRAYARRRLREPGRDLTVTSLPPTRKREIKREGKQLPFSFYSVYLRRNS